MMSRSWIKQATTPSGWLSTIFQPTASVRRFILWACIWPILQRTSESELQAARDILGLEVEKAWLEVQDQKDLHQLNRRAVRAARSLLVSHVQTYEDGIDENVTLDTILGAASTYLKRKAEWLRSVYAFNLGVAQLSRVIGTPMGQNP